MEFFWIFYLEKLKNPEKFPMKMRYFNAPALKDEAKEGLLTTSFFKSVIYVIKFPLVRL